MARIKDIPNFYELLHDMEKLRVTGIDQSGSRYKYGLGDIKGDDPRLLELRRLLGVTPERKKDTSKILTTYNTTVIKLYIEQSGRTNKEISVAAGINRDAFNKKLKTGKFRDYEIEGVEQALGLRKGALA